MKVTPSDLEALDKVLATSCFEKPALKICIYKNRRGRFVNVYLWCKADLGTCRIQPMFCTGYDYELKSLEDIKVIVEEDSAF